MANQPLGHLELFGLTRLDRTWQTSGTHHSVWPRHASRPGSSTSHIFHLDKSQSRGVSWNLLLWNRYYHKFSKHRRDFRLSWLGSSLSKNLLFRRRLAFVLDCFIAHQVHFVPVYRNLVLSIVHIIMFQLKSKDPLIQTRSVPSTSSFYYILFFKLDNNPISPASGLLLMILKLFSTKSHSTLNHYYLRIVSTQTI